MSNNHKTQKGGVNKNSFKVNPWLWGIKALLVLVQAVVSVMLIVSIINTGLVNGLVIGIVVIVLAALLMISGVWLLVRSKASVVTQITCAVLSLIVIIGGIFAMSYTGAFNSFLTRVTEDKPEMKQYEVLVKNDSEVQGIDELSDKSIGFLKSDPKAANAEQKLAEIVKFDGDFYDDVDTLLETLNGDISNAIVLETDRVTMLKEGFEDLAEGVGEAAAGNVINDTRVVYTFEIELESEALDVPDKEITTEPFVVYISGSDSREGVKATARSDVNIVAVVNPQTAKILLVSIPRDTYVQLHGTTGIKDKLTHAGVYGIDMSRTTIEDLLGVAIDYTIKVSFDTVVKVVDQLDGIDITSDQEMTLGALNGEKCHYTVGTQHIDGNCALRFARERKSYETGDRHRGENQQQVITSIVERLSKSKDYLLKIPAILDIAADSFETTLSREDVAKFIRMQLANARDWKVESIAINGAGAMEPTYSMGANWPLYVMIPYEDTITQATTKINEYLQDKNEVYN